MARRFRKGAVRIRIVVLAAVAGCSPSGAAASPIEPTMAARLETAFARALSAEQCAIARPYLNPIYRLPASKGLEDSRQDAVTAGLGQILDQAERKWKSEDHDPLRNCPTDPYRAYEPFDRSVRAFNRLLDTAIDQALARTPAAPPGTSAQLVKALIDARWALELSSPNAACAASRQTALVRREEARLGALRRRALRQGHAGEVDAADRRWAAEKVKWDRGTATVDMIVRCAAEKLLAANNRIESLLARRT